MDIYWYLRGWPNEFTFFYSAPNRTNQNHVYSNHTIKTFGSYRVIPQNLIPLTEVVLSARREPRFAFLFSKVRNYRSTFRTKATEK